MITRLGSSSIYCVPFSIVKFLHIVHIIRHCFPEVKAIWANTITAKMNGTQDKLPLRSRKWVVPRGFPKPKFPCTNEKLLRIILCSMCFSASANFLQRTMHVMSGMLNKDKKFHNRVSERWTFIHPQRPKKTLPWLFSPPRYFRML